MSNRRRETRSYEHLLSERASARRAKKLRLSSPLSLRRTALSAVTWKKVRNLTEAGEVDGVPGLSSRHSRPLSSQRLRPRRAFSLGLFWAWCRRNLDGLIRSVPVGRAEAEDKRW